MLTSLTFGAGFTTPAILAIVPAMLSIYKDAGEWLRQRCRQTADLLP